METICQKQGHFSLCTLYSINTQYAEGIYRHKYYTMTLKSTLNVTQGHWKRNHWIIHDLVVVELFDVEYYCDHENVG